MNLRLRKYLISDSSFLSLLLQLLFLFPSVLPPPLSGAVPEEYLVAGAFFSLVTRAA